MTKQRHTWLNLYNIYNLYINDTKHVDFISISYLNVQTECGSDFYRTTDPAFGPKLPDPDPQPCLGNSSLSESESCVQETSLTTKVRIILS